MAPSKFTALLFAFAVVAAATLPQPSEARAQVFTDAAAANDQEATTEAAAAAGGGAPAPPTAPGLPGIPGFPTLPPIPGFPTLPPIPGLPGFFGGRPGGAPAPPSQPGTPPSPAFPGFPLFPWFLFFPGFPGLAGLLPFLPGRPGAPPSSLSELEASATFVSASSPPAPAPKECMTPLMSVFPCLEYLTNTTVCAPPPECCAGYRSVVADAPICLCHGMNGGLNQFLPKPVDPIRMMMLPLTCGAMPPLSTLFMCSSPSVPPLMPPPSSPAPASAPVPSP